MLPKSNLIVDRRRPLGDHSVSPTDTRLVVEDAPANNAAGGNLAGVTGEPPVAKKNKYKAANLETTSLLRRTLKEHSSSLYYLQPDGSYKKGGDGRSKGLTKAEVDKIKSK
jgi:hypothetical protein